MPFKIYVDSRFRQDTGGAQSDCEFSIELPQPLKVTGRAFVDTCVVPNTFYTIRANDNDRIHVAETVSGTVHYRIATIAQGQYNVQTLKDAMVGALNTGRNIPLQYTVTYLTDENKLEIGTLDQAATFNIYSKRYLELNPDVWNNAASSQNQITPSRLMDAGLITGYSAATNLLQGNALNPITAPEMPNLQPYHQLFLRSSLGDGFSAIGPDGSSDIIRRITMTVKSNDIQVDNHGLPYDSVPVTGTREISSLSFRLTDVHGVTVNTNGHHISFSIIFIEEGE